MRLAASVLTADAVSPIVHVPLLCAFQYESTPASLFSHSSHLFSPPSLQIANTASAAGSSSSSPRTTAQNAAAVAAEISPSHGSDRMTSDHTDHSTSAAAKRLQRISFYAVCYSHALIPIVHPSFHNTCITPLRSLVCVVPFLRFVFAHCVFHSVFVLLHVHMWRGNCRSLCSVCFYLFCSVHMQLPFVFCFSIRLETKSCAWLKCQVTRNLHNCLVQVWLLRQ